jgi:hypothetical protein
MRAVRAALLVPHGDSTAHEAVQRRDEKADEPPVGRNARKTDAKSGNFSRAHLSL